MAFIDLKRQCLSVRIVFDGPAEAGKTATVEALAASFGEQVLTPEERDRRTLFFDWVEYTAGLFGGRAIRCQLITVPGQPALYERRETILATADAVVFVADSRASELESTRQALEECVRTVARTQPPCRVLVQANKRDCPDLAAPGAITEGIEGLAATRPLETVAVEGRGVREVFIHAVRLCLERVRRLDADGDLRSEAHPEGHDAQSLYDAMRDSPESEPAASEGWSEVLDRDADHLSPFARLLAPDEPATDSVADPLAQVREGSVWPPVEGRMFLADAARDVVKWSSEEGERSLGTGRHWYFETDLQRSFLEFEHGRAHLVEWARRHARCQGFLTTDRCLVVLPTGESGWQLWQVVRRQTSIRDVLEQTAWSGVPVEAAATKLVECWRAARAKATKMARCPEPLAIDLGTLAFESDSEPHVGLFRNTTPAADVQRAVHAELLQHFDRVREHHGDENLLRAMAAARDRRDEVRSAAGGA